MKTPFVISFLLLFCSTVSAQTFDCSTPEGSAKALAYATDSLKFIKEHQKKREAELDKEIKATAKRLSWTEQDQSKFFMSLIASPEFTAFEVEKRPLTGELMNMLMTMGSSDHATNCDVALRTKPIVEKIYEVNTRQYDFMSREITTAK